MKTVAVIGASGYVGKSLAKAIESHGNFAVTRVTRTNYSDAQHNCYDYVINSAMPSKRFWAKNNPGEDYKETVLKTTEIIKHWKYGKYVHISTLSARCEPESVYGAHKAAAEALCPEGALIIRLSAMFSGDLTKGALIDILNGSKVFVSGESRYPYASLKFVCDWMAQNLNRTGLIELGARNSISLREIADHLRKPILFEGPIEDQTLLNPQPEFPDATEVLIFMDKMTKAGKS